MHSFHSIRDLSSLTQDFPESIIYQCISGSRAYGTARPDSDEDIRGIFVLPQSSYLLFPEPVNQVSDEKNDVVFYSLRRFLELAVTANPNIIELLFMPEECILFKSPLMDRLIENRSLFITQNAYSSHVGYAHAQIKRARGQNKWINHPQPKDPPVKEKFCWIIPLPKDLPEPDSFPFRPLPLVQSGINLTECHCSVLEHCSDIFRLYHYGSKAKGVFRNGELVCESIPKEDEHARCIGLLIFNRTGYEMAKRDHHNYWDWQKNRNEARWKTQEEGLIDYDAKNMMHTFRLLLSGENILRFGEPIVRFSGTQLDFLKNILSGKFAYDDLIVLADQMVKSLKELRDCSPLLSRADPEKLNQLLRQITKEWESIHAGTH